MIVRVNNDIQKVTHLEPANGDLIYHLDGNNKVKKISTMT